MKETKWKHSYKSTWQAGSPKLAEDERPSLEDIQSNNTNARESQPTSPFWFTSIIGKIIHQGGKIFASSNSSNVANPEKPAWGEELKLENWDVKLKFGKNIGKTFQYIVEKDEKYVKWVLSTENRDQTKLNLNPD